MRRAWRTVQRLLVGVSVLLVAGCSQLAQRERAPAASPEAHADRADVLKTQRRRFAAMTTGDLAALERLLAVELTYIHTTGRLETKSEFLRSLATGAVRYHAIRPESLEVRVYGPAAVVTGRSGMEVQSGSQELRLLIRFTDVYARDGGEWRQVAWQSTRIPEVAPSHASRDDLIVFASQREGSREIYTMRPDGSGVRRLTPLAGPNRFSFGARWSPDRKRIAFYSNRDATVADARDEDFEIYVMNADGGNLRRLTHNGVMDRDPAWSPDGSRIAFASACDGSLEIYVMDLYGNNVQRLTYSDATDRESDWSPDGRRIAFSSDRDGSRQVYIMDADGANPRRLTYNELPSGGPAWSPDGSRIAYYVLGPGRQEMRVVDADGSNARRLAAHPGYRPRWSRSGAELVFQFNRYNVSDFVGEPGPAGSGFDIHVMSSDGTNVRQLTSSGAFDAYPDW